MTPDDRPDPAAALVSSSGQPIRRSADEHCPRCQADPSARVASGGFGRLVHDVCGQCGYEFAARTVRPPGRD